MSSSGLNLENFGSTLEDINIATSEHVKISDDSRHVDIGKLYELWQNRTAAIAAGNYLEEADQIISMLHHENIIPFYSDDQYNEYAIVGRLNVYFQNHENRQKFTWAQRLKTCIGIAKGLSYLHSGVGDHGRVIHGCVKSENVLLDEDLEAKISGLGGSVLVRGNQPRPEIYRPTISGPCSTDPVYQESSILNIESDIYSYGILMFQMLTGMEPDGQGRDIGDDKVQTMINLVLRFHDDGPEQLIDSYIKDIVDRRSFHMFINTAYKCISLNIKDRPTMDEIVNTIEEALEIHNQQAVSAIAKRTNPADSLEKFQISLEEILKATKNFSEETQIKKGDDIVVIYKGHLSDRLQKRTVAIKQYLTDKNFINVCKFLDELKMFSMLHHENIAPFIGYFETQESYDVNHRFIVSEYAVNGSLYNQLKDPNMNISWAQRLKICIGAAKGLLYLHSGFGEYKRVIHGDFSSRKILLYENLEAKICGFSRSLVLPGWGPAELVGDKYYMDPAYRQSHIRDKESMCTRTEWYSLKY